MKGSYSVFHRRKAFEMGKVPRHGTHSAYGIGESHTVTTAGRTPVKLQAENPAPFFRSSKRWEKLHRKSRHAGGFPLQKQDFRALRVPYPSDWEGNADMRLIFHRFLPRIGQCGIRKHGGNP